MNKRFIPPLPFLLIIAIALLEVLIWIKFKPDFSKPGGGNILLVHIFSILLVIIIYKKWTVPPPTCSLFYGPSGTARFDSSGNFIRYEDLNEQCGRKSFGKIKVISDSRGRSTEYFCEWHDPEVEWMKNWLKKEDLKICSGTIKRFSRIDDDDERPRI